MLPEAARREARSRVDASGLLAPLLERLLADDPDADGLLPMVLEAVVDGLMELVPCRGALLAVLDAPRAATVRIVAGHGLERLEGRRIPLGRSVVGYAMAAADTVVVSHAELDHRLDPDIDGEGGARLGTALAVPLRIGGAVVGCLELVDGDGGAFGVADRAVAVDLAPYLALATARIRSASARPESGTRILCRARLDGVRVADANLLHDADLGLVTSFDRPLLERCSLMPLRHVGDDRVAAAIADSGDLHTVDDFRFVTGLEVAEVWFVARDVLLAALDRAFDDPRSSDLRAIESSEADEVESSVDPSSIDALAADVIAAAATPGVRAVWIDPESDRGCVRVRSDLGLHVRRRYPLSLHGHLLRRVGLEAVGDGMRWIALPGGGRARWYEQPTLRGARGRLLPRAGAGVTPTLDAIGFVPESLVPYRDLLARRGAVIVHAGPRGSDRHVTAIAAAVESAVDGPVCVAHPYGGSGVVGAVELDVSGGLASALEIALEGGDETVVAGEVRQATAAAAVLELAAAGARVLATLHARDAVSALIWLRDTGAPLQRLDQVVVGVCAHRPVPRLCGACREPDRTIDTTSDLGGTLPVTGAMRSVGCDVCGGTGRTGVIAAHEVLRSGPELRAALVAGADRATLDELALHGGMWTFADDLTHKVNRGLVTFDAARRALR